MHVWLRSRLAKPLQGGPCSYYDLRGIAITASALRQNERTTHSAEACARAPVRNRPIKCVQWNSAPHRRAICLVVPISCCVDTLVADSPIPTVTESPGSHCGKRETARALVISHCHFAWNGNLLLEKKDEIFCNGKQWMTSCIVFLYIISCLGRGRLRLHMVFIVKLHREIAW